MNAQPAGQPGQDPARPGSPASQPGQAQLATALVDTPDGQRLAAIVLAGPVQVTALLTAADVKSWASVLGEAASSMSSSGLVVAGGALSQVRGMGETGQSPSK